MQRSALLAQGVIVTRPGQGFAGGGPASFAGGQAVSVLFFDDTDATSDGPWMHGKQRLAGGVGDGGMQHDLRLRGPDLHQLTRSGLAGGD